MVKIIERKLFFYRDLFHRFYNDQNSRVKIKIDWTLKLISTIERIPVKYLKHLESSNGLYEIRVEYGGNIFRIFCFFDEGDLIILLNGFQKKSQKTPQQEIKNAEKFKNQYFYEKENE
jgi:phage-related protein